MRTAKKSAATNARSFRTFLLMQQFDSEAIGARIAQARKEAGGMTQETLADLLGVSKRSVQDYEAGATIPWKQMREIARVLGKDVDWFMRGERESEPSTSDLESIEAGLERLRLGQERTHALLEELLQARSQIQ